VERAPRSGPARIRATPAESDRVETPAAPVEPVIASPSSSMIPSPPPTAMRPSPPSAFEPAVPPLALMSIAISFVTVPP
jgi:hypothetical protein